MRQELCIKLYEAFPDYFQERHLPETQSCMAYGVECGDGWYQIIFDLCRKIQLINPENFRFVQVKEKFGSLRIYYTPCTPDTNLAVSAAEHESDSTCERCGTKENVTQEGGWIKTLCTTCREAKERRWDV
jgi:hypothetical protein